MNTPTDENKLIPKCSKYDTDGSCRVCETGYISLEVANANSLN